MRQDRQMTVKIIPPSYRSNYTNPPSYSTTDHVNRALVCDGFNPIVGGEGGDSCGRPSIPRSPTTNDLSSLNRPFIPRSPATNDLSSLNRSSQLVNSNSSHFPEGSGENHTPRPRPEGPRIF